MFATFAVRGADRQSRCNPRGVYGCSCSPCRHLQEAKKYIVINEPLRDASARDRDHVGPVITPYIWHAPIIFGKFLVIPRLSVIVALFDLNILSIAFESPLKVRFLRFGFVPQILNIAFQLIDGFNLVDMRSQYLIEWCPRRAPIGQYRTRCF